jgi:hypothetical protein
MRLIMNLEVRVLFSKLVLVLLVLLYQILAGIFAFALPKLLQISTNQSFQRRIVFA